MQGEVDGGEGGLECGELGPGKGAVRNYAVDEGLVDGAAEEGAIADIMFQSVRDTAWGGRERDRGGWGGGGGGPDDVIGGRAVED